MSVLDCWLEWIILGDQAAAIKTIGEYYFNQSNVDSLFNEWPKTIAEKIVLFRQNFSLKTAHSSAIGQIYWERKEN